MKNIAIINAIASSDVALRPIFGDRSSLERAISAGRAMPDVEEVIVLCSRPPAGVSGVRLEERDTWSVGDLIASLMKHGRGHSDIFYFFADCPLVDASITARMHENHRKYYADYTFADGYPYGLTPEIMRVETASRLPAFSERVPLLGRETVFELIKQDINSFDIETELAPKDQRLLRVSLTADTERNFLLLSRLAALGASDASSVTRVLDEHPEIARTLPAFFPIQIVERCPQACTYCPYPRFGGDILKKNGAMEVEDFRSLVGKIVRFCGDAVIDVSLWGDPSMHPRFFDIAKAALERPGIDLVIETSGVGWDASTLRKLASELPRRPTWIVSLDAASQNVYASLRGPGFEESRATAQLLFEIFPQSVYAQAVRMKENEEDLETFFKEWKGKTEKLIIQKYDHFCGFLPERKVADLSPLKRFPCWHIKRDLAVLIDGTVCLCREDLGRAHVLGNASSEELSAVWARGEAFHGRHVSGDYPSLCTSCDEWYTYNF